MALAQIVSDVATAIDPVYDVAGVQVPVATEHHRIDAAEVASVMAVVCGITYVPVARATTGVAV
jgi:hypothetical protein